MNDELIDRLAELLEHAGPLPSRRLWNSGDYIKLLSDECEATQSLIRRVRTLIGASEQNPANYSAMLRKALS